MKLSKKKASISLSLSLGCISSVGDHASTTKQTISSSAEDLIHKGTIYIRILEDQAMMKREEQDLIVSGSKEQSVEQDVVSVAKSKSASTSLN